MSCAAAIDAFRLVQQGQCNCRPSTGRHHVVLVLLELLAKEGKAPWHEVLRQGKASAVRYNESSGLPADVAPAATKFETFSLYSRFQRYIDSGTPRDGRYSSAGPGVPTVVVRGPTGALIRLVQ